jgi:transmembrane sensor
MTGPERHMDMSTSHADTVQQQAADWFAQLRSGADAETRVAFARWQAADPAHAVAYTQVEALWGDPDLAAALFAGPPKMQRGAWLHRVATAAVIALSLGGMALFSSAGDAWLADHTAGSGLPQRVLLADGSHLLLDAGTAVDVDYSDRARRVILRRGRVLADVQPDTARPFTVAADEVTAQALGTVYTVARDDMGAAVSVREGEVLVSHGASSRVLQAGQALAAGGRQLQPVAAGDLAWTENRLVFTDRPLGEVLTDLDRYWPGVIWVRDAGLASLPVSGSYRLDDPPAVVAALAAATGARVSIYGGHLLTLTR